MDETQKRISAPDSIVNNGIVDDMQLVMQSSQERVLDVVRRVCEAYKGYAHMALMVAGLQVKYFDSTDDKNTNNSDEESILVEQLAALIKSRFSRELADAIIPQWSEIPPWLDVMMKDRLFRRTLIELYDNNKESTLLGLCLRQISALGFNGEIIKVIHDIDYFEVYENIMVDALCKLLTSDGPDFAVTANDMKRICCFTEYMFLYAMELLTVLEIQLQTTNSIVAVRRVRRLSQELEQTAIWSCRDISSGVLSNGAQFAVRLVRDLDGLTRRQALSSDSMVISSDSELQKEKEIFVSFECWSILRESSVSSKNIESLHRSCFCNNMDDAVIATEDWTSIQAMSSAFCHVEIVRQLVDCFSGSRQVHLSGAHRCAAAKLLCCAVSMLEKDAVTAELLSERCSGLLRTRELCSAIIHSSYGIFDVALAQELISLVESTPLFAMSSLRWADSLMHDQLFMKKNAFLVVLPVVFQIVASSSAVHPNLRPDCFELLKTVLVMKSLHDEEEGGYRMIQSSADTYTLVDAQCDALQCVVFLMSTGFVAAPMEFLMSKCSEFDGVTVILSCLYSNLKVIPAQVTLRNMLRLILTSVAAPFSETFLTALLHLLLLPSIRKAIHSSHFDHMMSLLRFIESVENGKNSTSLHQGLLEELRVVVREKPLMKLR